MNGHKLAIMLGFAFTVLFYYLMRVDIVQKECGKCKCLWFLDDMNAICDLSHGLMQSWPFSKLGLLSQYYQNARRRVKLARPNLASLSIAQLHSDSNVLAAGFAVVRANRGS